MYEENILNFLKKIKGIAAIIAGVIWLFISVYPILWMILTSLKRRVDSFSLPPKYIFKPTLENYQDVLFNRGFINFFYNSTIITILATLFTILLALFAAYSLARFNFKGNKDIAYWILTTRMAPPIAVIIPIYIYFQRIGLLDTRAGLIIMYTAINLPFAVWMLRSFIMEVPVELEESAMIDGCSRFKAFFKIVLPLIIPGILATAVFCFIFAWNEFLFALTLTGLDARTLPVAATAFMTDRGIMWGSMTAMATVIALPLMIITVFIQKYFVRGLTFGAVKQ